MNKTKSVALLLGAALTVSALWFFVDGPREAEFGYVEPDTSRASPPESSDVVEFLALKAGARTPLTAVPVEAQTDRPGTEPEAMTVTSGFEFRDHDPYYDGVPIDDLQLEVWSLMNLRNLLRDIRSQQAETLGSSVNKALLEHAFISQPEFSRQKLWFSNDVHFMTQRPTINENGVATMEDGFVKIPRSLCPDAYRLRELVRRVYAAPAYSAKLLDEGLAYERDVVLPLHPDAIAEITPDLAVWTFYSPEGVIVGQVYNPVNANN